MADETIITKSTSELIKARMNGEELEPFVRSAFQKTGGATLRPVGSEFGGEFKDTTRVFENPDDKYGESYEEIMEPGNIGPGISRAAPLPFYSAAWQKIMNRFANELPSDVLEKIDSAYKEELDKVNEREKYLQDMLGSDFDEFDEKGLNDQRNRLLDQHDQALTNARREQQDKSESEGKAKAEKILDKKAKKAKVGEGDIKEISEDANFS